MHARHAYALTIYRSILEHMLEKRKSLIVKSRVMLPQPLDVVHPLPAESLQIHVAAAVELDAFLFEERALEICAEVHRGRC